MKPQNLPQNQEEVGQRVHWTNLEVGEGQVVVVGVVLEITLQGLQAAVDKLEEEEEVEGEVQVQHLASGGEQVMVVEVAPPVTLWVLQILVNELVVVVEGEEVQMQWLVGEVAAPTITSSDLQILVNKVVMVVEEEVEDRAQIQHLLVLY